MEQNHDYFVQVMFRNFNVVVHLTVEGEPLPNGVIATGLSLVFKEILPVQPSQRETVELYCGCMTCGYSKLFAVFTVSPEHWEQYRTHLAETVGRANPDAICELLGMLAVEALAEYLDEQAAESERRKSLFSRMFGILFSKYQESRVFSLN